MKAKNLLFTLSQLTAEQLENSTVMVYSPFYRRKFALKAISEERHALKGMAPGIENSTDILLIISPEAKE